MSAVEKVLEEKPSNWEHAYYDSSTYELFELSENDEEFVDISKPFNEREPRLRIKSVKRIQNPFQLGRFRIRQSQNKFRHGDVAKELCYHPIIKNDLPTALEFNMDVRRYDYKFNANKNGKNPKFFRSPQKAIEAIEGSNEDKVVLVCHVLGEINDQKYDTEYMPIYVVTLS